LKLNFISKFNLKFSFGVEAELELELSFNFEADSAQEIALSFVRRWFSHIRDEH
jgi:hypothetical protein